jgi:hypothetical protein
MTTTSEVCTCQCEDCLALRAAQEDPGSGQTVAAFERDGRTYEIDHLGIGFGSPWDEFAVYCDGEEVAEFTPAESGPAGLPVSADELVRLARQALSARPRSHRPPPRRRRPRSAPGPAKSTN